MSRAERLLELMQCLRRRRHPVRGATLAAELGVSLRTLYRDIASLQAQGACIEGEPGIGYLLRPGFTLPPLMFSEEELEALALGARWVADRADEELSRAAQDALAKIRAVLTADLRRTLEQSPLLVGPCDAAEEGKPLLAEIRRAVRTECKLDITYKDAQGVPSTRTIWPFALGFFERVRLVVAWCELRGAFRNFRADRLITISSLDIPYPRRRETLLREWRESEGIPE